MWVGVGGGGGEGGAGVLVPACAAVVIWSAGTKCLRLRAFCDPATVYSFPPLKHTYQLLHRCCATVMLPSWIHSREVLRWSRCQSKKSAPIYDSRSNVFRAAKSWPRRFRRAGWFAVGSAAHSGLPSTFATAAIAPRDRARTATRARRTSHRTSARSTTPRRRNRGKPRSAGKAPALTSRTREKAR